MSTEDSCPICMEIKEEYIKPSDYDSSSCNHLACKDCWLKVDKCFMCRGELPDSFPCSSEYSRLLQFIDFMNEDEVDEIDEIDEYQSDEEVDNEEEKQFEEEQRIIRVELQKKYEEELKKERDYVLTLTKINFNTIFSKSRHRLIINDV